MLPSSLQTLQQGALPSRPVQFTDDVNAITLRSGSKYDGPSIRKDHEPIITKITNPDFVRSNNFVTSPAGPSSKTKISDDTLQGTTPN